MNNPKEATANGIPKIHNDVFNYMYNDLSSSLNLEYMYIVKNSIN